jgi:type III secretion system low calcium response chaperone LcrH/SycD
MSERVTLFGIEIDGFTANQKSSIERLMAGEDPKAIVGIGDADVEKVYAVGNQLYASAKYAQALPLLTVACTYQSSDARYWLALGACRQMLKDHEGAITAYGMSYALNSRDPWPLIHTSLCCLALSDTERAGDSLVLAERTNATSGNDKAAADRISALKACLS